MEQRRTDRAGGRQESLAALALWRLLKVIEVRELNAVHDIDEQLFILIYFDDAAFQVVEF